jgi:hypothetical protein
MGEPRTLPLQGTLRPFLPHRPSRAGHIVHRVLTLSARSCSGAE